MFSAEQYQLIWSKAMFYDYHETLKHGALLNFVVGAKGCRKTTGALCWGIDEYLAGNGLFLYVRRTKSELKSVNKLLDGISTFNYYPGHKFDVNREGFFMDDKKIGEYTPISTSTTEKGYPHPAIKRIIYDEFLPEGRFSYYSPTEIEDWYSLYEVYSRGRDIPMLALSNALTMTNPYFIFFGLHKPYGGKDYMIKNDVLLQIWKNKEFSDWRASTRFGKIMSGTKVGDFAMNNEFLLDDYNFIEKPSAKCSYLCTVIYNGISMGCLIDYDIGLAYITNKIEPSCKLTYALSTKDHGANTLLLKKARYAYGLSTIIEAFYLGAVRFSNIDVKNTWYKIIGLGI